MSAYLVARKNQPGPHGKTVSDRTRHHYAVAAKVFFKFCKQQTMIRTDPLKDYQCPGFNRKIVRVPTTEEVTKILNATKEFWDVKKRKGAKYVGERHASYYAVRNFAIVSGLVTTACRIGEMLSLTVADYRPDDQSVIFRDTKTGIDREVPISKAWVPFVNEYLERRPKEAKTDCLFVNRNGDAMVVGIFAKAFKDIAIFAGMEWLTLHKLRHYAATRLAERDLFAAKEILGHSRIETTMIYAHAQREHVRAIHKEVGLLDGVMETQTSQASKPIMVNKRSEKNKQRKILI